MPAGSYGNLATEGHSVIHGAPKPSVQMTTE